MNHFAVLLDLVCGRALPDAAEGRARRLELVASALLASIVFAALWGLAAGSHSTSLALANLYKVPMVVLLSAVCAVPAGMLAYKLVGPPCRGTDLLVAFAGGIFAGTLVLAVLAPILALYYHTSAWAGPMLGIATTFAALGVGGLIFVRAAFRRAALGPRRASIAIPVTVFLGLQLAAMLQLVALASPIFPEHTVFSKGVDHISEVQ